VAGV
jgi:hypothetical protein